MTNPLAKWSRVRSYVVREDKQTVLHLACGHSRFLNPTPVAAQRTPESWLGTRFPCQTPGCDGVEKDLPDGDAA
jgi:hypothetical protein